MSLYFWYRFGASSVQMAPRAPTDFRITRGNAGHTIGIVLQAIKLIQAGALGTSQFLQLEHQWRPYWKWAIYFVDLPNLKIVILPVRKLLVFQRVACIGNIMMTISPIIEDYACEYHLTIPIMYILDLNTGYSSSGWWFQPLWNILVKWNDYSQYMENNVPNHQPVHWHIWLQAASFFHPMKNSGWLQTSRHGAPRGKFVSWFPRLQSCLMPSNKLLSFPSPV